jgi:predicted Rossmann fold nucleotide-binding protein DprA/Smf involved in DNA uptake
MQIMCTPGRIALQARKQVDAMNESVSRRYAIVGGRSPKEATEDNVDVYVRVLEAVKEFVDSLPDGSIVISGGANGVDSVAAQTARDRGLQVIEHLPDYKNQAGNIAPLVRNKLIVDDCDVLVAFPTPWSTGTWHAVSLAKKANKVLQVRTIR